MTSSSENARGQIGVALAAAVVTFGATKLLAQLFLADWAISSSGQPDIAARGSFLLGSYLPLMAAASMAAATTMAAVLTHRSRVHLVIRMLVGLSGSVMGALAILIGLDPTVDLLQLVRWSSDLAYYVGSSVVGAMLAAGGVILMVRSARRIRSAEMSGKGPW